MMEATLKDVLRACKLDLKKYLTKRDKWIGNWPGQVRSVEVHIIPVCYTCMLHLYLHITPAHYTYTCTYTCILHLHLLRC